jgi:hypothetical protein
METLEDFDTAVGADTSDYAASSHQADFFTHIEIQVVPGKLKVYASTSVYRARRGVWCGPEAVAIGKAVCAGECPREILADWCQDHAPESCDHDFDVPTWLRMTW